MKLILANSNTLISTITILGGLGGVFGVLLAIADKIFFVKVDEKIALIDEALPQANCGACGYPGCAGYAEAIVNKGVETALCAPGGAQTAVRLARIMGTETGQSVAKVVKVQCQGGCDVVKSRFYYNGIADCGAAVLLHGGDKECAYGCLGYGSCVKACPFGAIRMGPDAIPVVDEDRCTGCGKCVAVCPRAILKLTSGRNHIHMGCLSRDKGKDVRAYCGVGCIGCQKCVKVCPVEGGAVHMEGFIAVIDHDKCTSCGKCFEDCPTGSIVKILKNQKRPQKKTLETQTQKIA